MMVRPILRAPDPNPEGLSELDWVRKLCQKGVGKIEYLVDGTKAWVNWLNGFRTLEMLVYLRRAEPREKDGRVER